MNALFSQETLPFDVHVEVLDSKEQRDARNVVALNQILAIIGMNLSGRDVVREAEGIGELEAERKSVKEELARLTDSASTAEDNSVYGSMFDLFSAETKEARELELVN